MWWTGNVCFISFCGTFLVLSGPSPDLAGPLEKEELLFYPGEQPRESRKTFCSFHPAIWVRDKQCPQLQIRVHEGKCLVLQKEKKKRALKTRSEVLTYMVVGASVCVSICQCIQLLSWWKLPPGRQAQSSEFKFRFHFEDAFCLVKPPRGRGGPERSNQRTSAEDW